MIFLQITEELTVKIALPAKKSPGIFWNYDLENLEISWNFIKKYPNNSHTTITPRSIWEFQLIFYVAIEKKCTWMYWNMNYHVLEYTGNLKLYSTGKLKMYWKMYWNVLEFHYPFCVATLYLFSLIVDTESWIVVFALRWDHEGGDLITTWVVTVT